MCFKLFKLKNQFQARSQTSVTNATKLFPHQARLTRIDAFIQAKDPLNVSTVKKRSQPARTFITIAWHILKPNLISAAFVLDLFRLLVIYGIISTFIQGFILFSASVDEGLRRKLRFKLMSVLKNIENLKSAKGAARQKLHRKNLIFDIFFVHLFRETYHKTFQWGFISVSWRLLWTTPKVQRSSYTNL